MKFGPVPVDEAAGAILAHSQRVGETVLKKGTYLTDADTAALMEAGFRTITVARMMPGDVHENEAATRLAKALVPAPGSAGMRVSNAGTGRVNLYAEAPGILDVAADKISALNSIDPMIGVSTLPRWQRVEQGMMLATIKIISYAVPQTALEETCSAGRGALRVRRAVYRDATLIETRTETGPDSDKGQKAIAERLERLGVAMTDRHEVAHKTAPLAASLWDAKGEVIFILTASATSDPADVAPAAVRAAGGTITRFGMPVDPGNLLFLGELKGKTVIGLPGCARSPALNGADWVLERVLCGCALTSEDIAQMGVGGLLKDIPTRPVPRRRIEAASDDTLPEDG